MFSGAQFRSRLPGYGPRVFRRYLHFAETGILDIGETTGRDYDTEFERQIGREARKRLESL